MTEPTIPTQEPCNLYGDIYNSFEENEDDTVSTSKTSTTPSLKSDKVPLKSMLVTGFGLRRWESLQKALLDDEQRRQMLLAQYGTGETEALECDFSSDESAKKDVSKSTSSLFSTSEEVLVNAHSTYLEYLMGIGEPEEESEEPKKICEPSPSKLEFEDGEFSRTTVAMRKARNYLQQHKIFEFFRFLISHLLSELPDNPIQYLIDLLDRCLLYRSGFGNPPLLYERAHIGQLFNLMDRMRTGFIDKEQYETGMKTLGICFFDKKPPRSTDGLVSRNFFVDEAYECLTDVFVDMIRRHGEHTPSLLVTPPPTRATPSFASQ